MFTNIKKLFKAKEEEIKELKLDKFQLFLDLVNSYLKREYPSINFDLSFYKDKKEEDNLKVQKATLIAEVIRQFADFHWEKKTQKSVKKEILWSGYGVNSQPSKKIPQDFLRRKELVFFREEGICNRCGNIMDKIQKSSIILAQGSGENGGYNIENLILLCSSCYNLTQNKDKSFSEIPLRIRDDLYDLI
jgi:5-methylcytosine-specific restriction endonuclease McrA